MMELVPSAGFKCDNRTYELKKHKSHAKNEDKTRFYCFFGQKETNYRIGAARDKLLVSFEFNENVSGKCDIEELSKLARSMGPYDGVWFRKIRYMNTFQSIMPWYRQHSTTNWNFNPKEEKLLFVNSEEKVILKDSTSGQVIWSKQGATDLKVYQMARKSQQIGTLISPSMTAVAAEVVSSDDKDKADKNCNGFANRIFVWDTATGLLLYRGIPHQMSQLRGFWQLQSRGQFLAITINTDGSGVFLAKRRNHSLEIKMLNCFTRSGEGLCDKVSLFGITAEDVLVMSIGPDADSILCVDLEAAFKSNNVEQNSINGTDNTLNTSWFWFPFGHIHDGKTIKMELCGKTNSVGGGVYQLGSPVTRNAEFWPHYEFSRDFSSKQKCEFAGVVEIAKTGVFGAKRQPRIDRMNLCKFYKSHIGLS